MIQCIIVVAALLSSTLPALAQPPHLSPTRDVTVRHRVTAPPTYEAMPLPADLPEEQPR